MNKLRNALQAAGIPLSEDAEEKMKRYMDGILEWNEKVNLTAITDREEFAVKHLADSLLCMSYKEYAEAEKIIDVGTGAGFPGVPLAIMSPEKNFVLMDSLDKRLKIVAELAGNIGLRNVETIHGRAEDLARYADHREAYDLCVSRAVANLAVLAEYCLPLVRKGGYMLAYKGPGAEKEAEEGRNAVEALGGMIVSVEKSDLPGFNMDHRIIRIQKVEETPGRFPRKPGIPTRDPLK